METKKTVPTVNQPYTEPDPNAYTQYQREIYSSLRSPSISTKPSEWEARARETLPLPNFLFVYGAASSGTTNCANRAAFDHYLLRPSMLVNATRRDLSVDLFGTRYPSPLLVAPIGVQEIVHSDAEEATARACSSLKVPMILSSAATRSLEQVAKANGDGDRWFQLYWPKPQMEEITLSLLKRAKENGYKVLVVTLDTFNLAWRPNDLDTSYLPFVWGQGCQVGLTDPVFNRIYDEMTAAGSRPMGMKLAELWDIVKRPGTVSGALKVMTNVKTFAKSQAWLEILNSGTYREWQHLEILKKHWDGPIVLKGIQTVEDAHRAIEYGMNGIVVSNHGGRQLDGAIASLDALAEIGADEKVKKSGITVLFDSGIRTGSDVLKALALGAKAVLIGRPYIYGLSIGGEAGVRHVLRCTLADTDNMLGNMGKANLSDLSRNDLRVLQQPAKL
ncbi:FMN-dependent alpha-hydroxy acid dehydrogenase-like protein [Lepidopterella palustris CBS 459.81]|uniref:FMN-dependent alpha-hydroxy acid dehydrogenase-like protein n=1 Tax=Lepidopterella palustris CBS 459.81 TaxID=1314670 RepID=A0A8E2JH04_9PEZI|nr:FMN-dependent alpha-hydroxy acid dehydrogenase-like protein [Lepidopterella palustris CBS 459.81]